MIGQEEAKEMMKRDDGHIIVDVRRQDNLVESIRGMEMLFNKLGK